MEFQQLLVDDLRIRPFQPTDIQDYWAILSDPLNEQMGGQPRPQNMEQAKQWLQNAINAQTLAIERVSEAKVVGLIEQQPRFKGQPPLIDETEIQLGFLMNATYRRLGIMYHSLNRLFTYYKEQHLQAVWAGVFPENQASIKLLTKLGFQYRYTVDLSHFALDSHNKEAYYELTL
ncbi:GNAT family N-acetyltransferase [Agrilactobacillus fermenti]|uniref:GNAT family N-acetyltransferase n=1 Tax=Agrilactobacillus fermenti TaxID=2586909 RepID=UPI003A5C1741